MKSILTIAAISGFLAVTIGAFGAHGLKDLLGENLATYLFGIGILFFSGSLYALSISGIRILGAITPIGGILFLAGWSVLGYTSSRKE